MTPSYIDLSLSLMIVSSILQSNLDLLVNWCNVWQMDFNYTKCKHLYIGLNSPSRHYTMGSGSELYQISTTDEETDLGITFSHDFKFRSHIHKIAQKANKVLGVINHTFKYLDPDIMHLLYTNLVHPHLDYMLVIYGTPTCWKTCIPKVQRRATKLILSFNQFSYYERLSNLNLPSLQYCYLRMDPIITYKILRHCSPQQGSLFTMNNNPTRTNGLKIHKYHCNKLENILFTKNH